jgi:hypothetical protein
MTEETPSLGAQRVRVETGAVATLSEAILLTSTKVMTYLAPISVDFAAI